MFFYFEEGGIRQIMGRDQGLPVEQAVKEAIPIRSIIIGIVDTVGKTSNMSPSQTTLQKNISAYSQLIYEKGWVANHDGNLSARLADNKRFMVTPTAESKRLIAPHDTLVVDIDGKRLSGRRRLFRMAFACDVFQGASGVTLFSRIRSMPLH